MARPAPPRIDCEQEHASLAVSDVRAAADFYAHKLGFTVGFLAGDPPTIAGMNFGNVQMFQERGTPSPSGTSAYFVVGDAGELYEFQRAQGVEIVEPPEP